jgi:hypothetical protein
MRPLFLLVSITAAIAIAFAAITIAIGLWRPALTPPAVIVGSLCAFGATFYSTIQTNYPLRYHLRVLLAVCSAIMVSCVVGYFSLVVILNVKGS